MLRMEKVAVGAKLIRDYGFIGKILNGGYENGVYFIGWFVRILISKNNRIVIKYYIKKLLIHILNYQYI